jgi:hypothetical protein
MKKTKRLKYKWWLWILILLLLPLATALRLHWFSGSSVILCGSAARDVFNQCSRSAPKGVSGYYLPSLIEVHRLESALPQYLSTQRQLGKPINFLNYHFQYAGFTRNGHNMIYINAFRPDGVESFNWRFNPVLVCDGGSSFFGVEFDTQTEKFSNFSFNGLA